MTRARTVAAFIAAVTLISMLLCGCGKTGDGSDTTALTPDTTGSGATVKDALTVFANGKSDFCVVYAAGSDTAAAQAKMIARELSRFTGIEFEATADSARPLAEYGSTPEILVGITDRPESEKATADLRFKDYTVTIEGEKIIVAARDQSAMSNAATYFVEMILLTQISATLNDPRVIMRREDCHTYVFRTDYTIEKMSVLDVPIDKYTIVYPEGGTYSARRTANYIRFLIADRAGIALPVVGDSAARADYEIIVGKTAHGGDDPAADLGSYSVRLAGNDILITADGMLGYENVSEYLSESVIRGKELVIDSSIARVGAGTDEEDADLLTNKFGDYRVMFFNILGNCDIKKYPTRERNKLAAELITAIAPDVFGLQECSPSSRGAESVITALAAAGYAEVDADVPQNNYTPILYDSEKLRVIDKGWLLYSGGGVVDKSKSVTWAVFEGIKDGKRFAVCSTHYHHKAENTPARVSDAGELANINRTIAQKYNCPIISGGDLNCRDDSEPFRAMLDAGMTDLHALAPDADIYKTSHTYPQWNENADLYLECTMPNKGYEAAIDHAVLYNGEGLTPRMFNVVTLKYALLASDHCPIVVDFDIR